jgi:hypothetical protein
MNCNSFEELIALHAEGDLESSQAISVELHLKSCASCQRFLAELKASQTLVKELAEESLDTASFNVVRQRVMQEVNRRQETRVWWRFLSPALAEWRPAWAAALVALVALGFLLQWQLWQRPAGSAPPDVSTVTSGPTVGKSSSEATARSPVEQTKQAQQSPDLRTTQFAKRQRSRMRQEQFLSIGAEPGAVTEEPEQAVEQGSNLQPEESLPTDIAPEPPPPLVIKLVTDDPNIVIIWLVDQEVHNN